MRYLAILKKFFAYEKKKCRKKICYPNALPCYLANTEEAFAHKKLFA